jgi:hypothetical protein
VIDIIDKGLLSGDEQFITIGTLNHEKGVDGALIDINQLA